MEKNKAMHPLIRLRESDVEAIKTAFRKYFGPNDKLWIFGSRVDLLKRGGDIDLYVETDMTLLDDVLKKKSRFVGELWDAIGEQKIDVVLHLLSDSKKELIYKIAREKGVRLA